jgi:hypothetical protein
LKLLLDVTNVGVFTTVLLGYDAASLGGQAVPDISIEHTT